MKTVIKELTKRHVDQMQSIRGGATIFGYANALLLREIQQYDPELVTLIDDMDALADIVGEDGLYDEGRLAYFGAILTPKGEQFLKEVNEQ